MPGIYVADVEQNNFKEGQTTVRTACVFRKVNDRTKFLAADVIPSDWPDKPYLGQLRTDPAATLGIFFIFIVLGLNTILNALGIFIASVLNLGIRVYSLQTLYQAAFFLGIVQMLFSLIPNLSLFVEIALESIALLITSFVIKGLKLDWAAGYKVVALGAIVIIIVKTIPSLLILAGISLIIF